MMPNFARAPIEQRSPQVQWIPHSRPSIAPEDAAAAAEVISRGMLTTGDQVAAFEADLARAVGVAGAVATSSGTSALHLALLALGIGSGDQVIVPSWVCTAVMNAVKYVGASVVVVDVDAETGCICPAAVWLARTPHTRAIIVPHMCGVPADVDALSRVGVPVIEDCAQAVGATYRGRPVGSIGLLSVYSFYATKVIATGHGGMLASTDEVLLARARDLVRYDNRDDYRVRYNYGLTDFQAALGRKQLGRLPELLTRRREIADRYRNNGVCDWPGPQDGCIYFRYLVRVSDPEQASRWFAERGIEAKRPVFRPLHHYTGDVGCPMADRIHGSVLSIPLYPALLESEIASVVRALCELPVDLALPSP